MTRCSAVGHIAAPHRSSNRTQRYEMTWLPLRRISSSTPETIAIRALGLRCARIRVRLLYTSYGEVVTSYWSGFLSGRFLCFCAAQVLSSQSRCLSKLLSIRTEERQRVSVPVELCNL